MKRRHFLAISSLAAPVAARAADVEDTWWGLIENVFKFTAKSEEGNLTLDVELEIPREEDLVELPPDDGGYAGYSFRDEKLPLRFWPGEALIKKFSFKWDGKPIKIGRRFWRDLAGFTIQTVPNKPALREGDAGRYHEFLTGLLQPCIMLSSEKGTALIEWERSEECDGRSTVRWIISRSGTVLRHRYEPFHDC